MDNNENKIHDQVYNTEEKNDAYTESDYNKDKKITIVLFVIVLILLLGIGIGTGFLLSKNRENRKNETQTVSENSTNQTENSVSKNEVNKVENNKDEYTEEELIKMALEYYESKNNYNPEHAVIDGEKKDGEVSIKVFEDHEDHITTLDVYTVNTKTAVGTDILENKIDLKNKEKDNNLKNEGRIIKVLGPSGWAGCSNYRIRLYENGDVYYIVYNGAGYLDENIVEKELIAKNADDIEEKTRGQAVESIIIKGKNLNIIKENAASWLFFEKNKETNSNYAQEYINIIDQVKKEYPDSNITCELIYFNNDNIPDLVVGLSGYWVSLYMYEDGKVYNPIDEWGYGAMGNAGYMYLEKKGIISNHNSDYAGGISTDSISILNSEKDFDVLSVRGKGADIESTDPMYEEIQKDLKETGGYYYNSKKISEQEYNNKLKELSINFDSKNFKLLDGSKTIEEVKTQLQ